jgi:hypothetical protein
MTIQGMIVNGAVVLDQPAPVPDGTRVEVMVSPPAQPAEAEREATLGFMLKYAGLARDMPADFSAQHDHYLHGTPKK